MDDRRGWDAARGDVSPSEYLMEKFSEHGYKNLVYIPNYIEVSNYPFHQRVDIGSKLLWVRSFTEIYNPILALKVVEELQRSNIPVELYVIVGFCDVEVEGVPPSKVQSHEEAFPRDRSVKLIGFALQAVSSLTVKSAKNPSNFKI